VRVGKTHAADASRRELSIAVEAVHLTRR
jgi:hypothetical protein